MDRVGGGQQLLVNHMVVASASRWGSREPPKCTLSERATWLRATTCPPWWSMTTTVETDDTGVLPRLCHSWAELLSRVHGEVHMGALFTTLVDRGLRGGRQKDAASALSKPCTTTMFPLCTLGLCPCVHLECILPLL